MPVAFGSVVVTGLTFSWASPAAADDTIAPDATIDQPAIQDEVYGRRALTFAGVATDDTGVASVGIAFQDRESRLWYRPDGTWGPYHRFTAKIAQPGTKKTAWSYPWTPPSDGGYIVQVVVKDTSGHPDAVLPFRRFDVDVTAPNTAVTSPRATTTKIRKGRTAVITGTARDDHGVRYVYVAIQNTKTRKWLRPGGKWGAIYWHQRPVNRPGAPSTQWRYSQKMSSIGTFLIQFAARDRAGLADPSPVARKYTATR